MRKIILSLATACMMMIPMIDVASAASVRYRSHNNDAVAAIVIGAVLGGIIIGGIRHRHRHRYYDYGPRDYNYGHYYGRYGGGYRHNRHYGRHW